DVVTLRVHNHALHTSKGPDLTHVTGSTGLHDHWNWVVVWVQILDSLSNLVSCVLPQLDQTVVALTAGELTAVVLNFDLACRFLVAVQHFFLVRKNQNVRHSDGHTGTG